VSSFHVLYPEYRCSHNAPLGCDRVQQTVQDHKGARFCMDCGFPVILSANQKIEGRRGVYQIKKYLGARGNGRLYAGIQLDNHQPVLIKEYLLPDRCFNSEETQQRKITFMHVAGLTPADGRIQDFRLVPIIEAIADARADRCYLISQESESSMTLAHYLVQQGAMTASQVRTVLDQTLQTLQFLHNQKLRRPSGQIDRGVAHGNLNLESLLLVGNAAKFQIYLCDLADWEFLFRSALPQSPKLQPVQDLTALGQVAFYLWNGRTTDLDGQPLDPHEQQHWPSENLALKQLILRLMGLEPPFESAEAARQALRQLPSSDPTEPDPIAVTTNKRKKWLAKRWLILLLGFLIGLIGAGLWSFFHSQSSAQSSLADYQRLPLKKFADVSGIESGEFRYVSEQNGSWSSVLNLPLQNGTLGEILSRPKSDVEAHFIWQGQSTAEPSTAEPSTTEQTTTEAGRSNPNALLSLVQQEKADFAITSLADRLPSDLEKIQVAYDGLLVFVPFNKGETLPRALNGQISLESLQRLYTGAIENWQELGGFDLEVVLHAPTEPEAMRQFEAIVLQDDPQIIAQFRQNVSQYETRETLEQGRRAFAEGRAGIISFGLISRVWNQCGGYPLALRTNGNPVQVLRRSNGQPITPDINLCDKANHLNVNLFQTNQYPLGYPLFVVYPKDNRRSAGRKFAELLTTQEGQCSLSQVGLVPLQPVPDNCSDLLLNRKQHTEQHYAHESLSQS
jgi:hypothetical protein